MTCEEALSYIHNAHWHDNTPGLSWMRTLLHSIGDPQNACRFIHVAGTNGKGSVCAMLDSVLRAAGYAVGLYTSPYIIRFHERMCVNGEPIRDGELAAITEWIRPYADRMEKPLCEFELTTAIAFEYFRRHQVDLVVLEVGLGGRLDPTNVIDAPLLSVITGIDFDHMKQLGNTIQTIAAEKAGIIKEGHPCLYGGSDSSACRTVSAIASFRHSSFYTVDRSRIRVRKQTLDGTVFDFDKAVGFRLPLLGVYQSGNAATVLTALEILTQNGLAVPEDAIRQGFSTVTWHARFELLRRNDPAIIFDGSHNPQGIGAAVQSIQNYFPEQRVNLLTGVMADKDYDVMIEMLKPVIAQAFTVTPSNPRALTAEEYAAHFHAHKLEATAYADVPSALRAATASCRAEQIPLLCLGSLYLYASVLTALNGMENPQN